MIYLMSRFASLRETLSKYFGNVRSKPNQKVR